METGVRVWLGAAVVLGVAASAACGGAVSSQSDGGARDAAAGQEGGSSGGGSSSGTGSSGSSSSSGATSSGGTSSSTSSSGSSSGGTSSSGGSSGAAAGSQVSFSQCLGAGCSYGSAGPSFSFYAAFFVTTPLQCYSSVAGACTLTTCSAYQGNYDSAGTLTLAGGSLPPGTTEQTSDVSFNAYATPVLSTGAVFAPGQTLSVSASGATVPAFGPQSITAPGIFTVTAPTWAGGSSPIVSASSDLALAWTGGQAGATVTFSLAGFNQSARSDMILSCAWDATAGQGTVPHTLFAQMIGYSQDAPGGSWYGGFAQQTTTSFSAGAYLVTLSAVVQQDSQIYAPTIGP